MATNNTLNRAIADRFPGYHLVATLPPSILLEYEVRNRNGNTYEEIFVCLGQSEYLIDAHDGSVPRKSIVARVYFDPALNCWIRKTSPGTKGAIRYEGFVSQELALADALRWAKRRFRIVELDYDR
jgi:hypothetical protein